MTKKSYLKKTWKAYAGDGKGNLKFPEHEDIDNYYLVRYPDRYSESIEIFCPAELGAPKDDQEVIIGYKIHPHLLQIIEIIP